MTILLRWANKISGHIVSCYNECRQRANQNETKRKTEQNSFVEIECRCHETIKRNIDIWFQRKTNDKKKFGNETNGTNVLSTKECVGRTIIDKINKSRIPRNRDPKFNKKNKSKNRPDCRNKWCDNKNIKREKLGIICITAESVDVLTNCRSLVGRGWGRRQSRDRHGLQF